MTALQEQEQSSLKTCECNYIPDTGKNSNLLWHRPLLVTGRQRHVINTIPFTF